MGLGFVLRRSFELTAHAIGDDEQPPARARVRELTTCVLVDFAHLADVARLADGESLGIRDRHWRALFRFWLERFGAGGTGLA